MELKLSLQRLVVIITTNTFFGACYADGGHTGTEVAESVCNGNPFVFEGNQKKSYQRSSDASSPAIGSPTNGNYAGKRLQNELGYFAEEISWSRILTHEMDMSSRMTPFKEHSQWTLKEILDKLNAIGEITLFTYEATEPPPPWLMKALSLGSAGLGLIRALRDIRRGTANR